MTKRLKQVTQIITRKKTNSNLEYDICPLVSVKFYFGINTGKNNNKQDNIYQEVSEEKVLISMKKRHNGKINAIL